MPQRHLKGPRFAIATQPPAAKKNYPEYFKAISVDEVRRLLYRKWDENTVGPAVDVRAAAVIPRTHIDGKQNRKKALAIFDRLVKHAEYTYQEALKEYSVEFPDSIEPKLPKPRSLLTSMRNLAATLSQYDPDFLELYGRKNSPSTEQMVEGVRAVVAAAQRFLKRLAS